MRALLSVYDKTGLDELARGLDDLGVELVASGGTAKLLQAAGIDHREVAELTGVPEMLGGRVKTLHPAIHAGILADRSVPSHLEDLASQHIVPIDIVVCNLYPFEAKPSVEMMDVGGPTMIRAAAKNCAHVTVVVDPGQYGAVLEELRATGVVSDATRRRLARAAFAHTAAYDAAIVRWLDATGPEAGTGAEVLPETLSVALARVRSLRYGENPHQKASLYRARGNPPGWWEEAVQYRGHLQDRRKEVAATLTASVLELYERIRTYRPLPAVAQVRDGLCTACNVRLRPQWYNEIRLSESVMVCENCSRILYYIEPKEEEQGTGDRVEVSGDSL